MHTRCRSFYTLLLTLLICIPLVSRAQEKSETPPTSSASKAEPRYFHLIFVLQEVEDGHVINSRRYTVVASTDNTHYHPSIRATSRVPYSAGGSQFTYLNLEVNIDCNNVEINGDRLSLGITSETSTLAPTPEASVSLSPVANQATIRSNKWTSAATVILGKPTVLFTSDDLASKRTMQLELTATPVR